MLNFLCIGSPFLSAKFNYYFIFKCWIVECIFYIIQGPCDENSQLCLPYVINLIYCFKPAKQCQNLPAPHWLVVREGYLESLIAAW